MKNTLIWIIFSIITIGLFAFFLRYPAINYGGDIVEYHGVTETLLKNHAIHLTEEAKHNLAQYLQPEYLEDPGYYVQGRDGERYPVHFIFYSILAIPARLFLKLMELNELNALRLTNLLIFSAASFYILKNFLQSPFRKLVFLLTAYLSPLIWFLIWPGPDVYYASLLLVAVFFFYRKHFFAAALLAALASWHSQPLIVLTGGLLLYYVLSKARVYSTLPAQEKVTDEVIVEEQEAEKLYGYGPRPAFAAYTPAPMTKEQETINNEQRARNKEQEPRVSFIDKVKAINIHVSLLPLLLSMGMIAIAFIPYLYNLWAFGVLTPWTILQDGWTQIHGFGIHNADPKKLFEQLFDLNIGLFWYAPVIFLAGFFFAVKDAIKNNRSRFLLGLLVLTALFYQTNPAWHYGTSGYGPTRHILFLLPFLMYFTTVSLKPKFQSMIVLALLVVSQAAILSFNGYLVPGFMNSLHHSPQALYVLNNYPALYNPTPEIFVDRTTHTDEKFPHSAIHAVNSECKKAYVLITEIDRLKAECGFIPEGYEAKLDNPFTRKANVKRETVTTEATFWPDPGSCGEDFYPTPEKPYICMKSVDDVVQYTGVQNRSRIKSVDDLAGVWRIETGEAVRMTIPPGYIIHHKSFEGVYVTY